MEKWEGVEKEVEVFFNSLLGKLWEDYSLFDL